MNVVIWARVSSREQQEGYSIDAQLRALRNKVTKNDWNIVREFVIAESAKRGADRKAFNNMLEWVRRNAKKEKIDAIFAHKLDRICRNMRDAVRLQELEDDHGVKLAFVENEFGKGAAGTLGFNVMAAVAQYYSDNLRGEVLKGMDERVRQGWPTGLASFGYLNVSDRTEPVIPHPEKAKVLARLFELYASGQHTFKSLANKLQDEGYTYRPSKPRFYRTAMSRILRNRFYIGELHRHGKVFQGKYRLVIDRKTFDACQDIMDGRNRRTGKPELAYSGGLLSCAHCGAAITGERIRRKQRDGSIREHVYYRCGNNDPEADHPKVRWRESELETAILEHLEAFRLPTKEAAEWLRQVIEETFDDRDKAARQQRRMLKKRRTELAGMQERLLDGYLSGAIEDSVFTAKKADLKAQQEETERQSTELPQNPVANKETALGVFDFVQSVTEMWRGSNIALKREILDCISLNRTLSDVSLYVERRKPFDIFAKRPSFPFSRGDCRSFEPPEPDWGKVLAPLFRALGTHVVSAVELAKSFLQRNDSNELPVTGSLFSIETDQATPA